MRKMAAPRTRILASAAAGEVSGTPTPAAAPAASSKGR